MDFTLTPEELAEAKAQAIVEKAKREGRLPELVKEVEKARAKRQRTETSESGNYERTNLNPV